MTFVLTGLEQEAQGGAGPKQALVTAMGGADRVRDGRDHDGRPGSCRLRPDGADQERLERAAARDRQGRPTSALVGRAFSSAAVELALASYPGYFTTTPPGPASSFGVYWPALVPATEIDQIVVLADGTRIRIDPPPTGPASERADRAAGDRRRAAGDRAGHAARHVFGARSGDKGGNANVGIWARDDAGYAWLAATMTPDVVRRLIPEAADLEVNVHQLPNLRALNIVLVGYLGEGVASSTAFDPQAKGLGEYLRSGAHLERPGLAGRSGAAADSPLETVCVTAHVVDDLCGDTNGAL